MKKVIFVLAASAICLLVFAFSKKAETATRYTFKFNTALPYTQANVENPANWSAASGTESCDGMDEKACTLEVDASFVSTSGSQPALRSAISIDTNVDVIHNTAYVTGTADGSSVIQNRSN